LQRKQKEKQRFNTNSNQVTLFIMNKSELVGSIATKSGLSKEASKKALDACVESIVEALKSGDKVALVGFGTFSVSERAARQGINPATKATITIPAKKIAKFKAGADVDNAIN
jgi:DNA-binding protein HU-beta